MTGHSGWSLGCIGDQSAVTRPVAQKIAKKAGRGSGLGLLVPWNHDRGRLIGWLQGDQDYAQSMSTCVLPDDLLRGGHSDDRRDDTFV
jgi:hypothetical protein